MTDKNIKVLSQQILSAVNVLLDDDWYFGKLNVDSDSDCDGFFFYFFSFKLIKLFDEDRTSHDVPHQECYWENSVIDAARFINEISAAIQRLSNSDQKFIVYISPSKFVMNKSNNLLVRSIEWTVAGDIDIDVDYDKNRRVLELQNDPIEIAANHIQDQDVFLNPG